MCKCNPNVRTPFCGKPGCEMPAQVKQAGVNESIAAIEIREFMWSLYDKRDELKNEVTEDGYDESTDSFREGMVNQVNSTIRATFQLMKRAGILHPEEIVMGDVYTREAYSNAVYWKGRIKKYTRKVMEVEAAQWDDSLAMGMRINSWNGNQQWDVIEGGALMVPTRQGLVPARPGDYVIKGVQGEFYVCEKDSFNILYEEETQ